MTKEEIKKQIEASIRLYDEGYILNYGVWRRVSYKY